MNLLPYLDVPGDTSGLENAWRQMVYRTWGKMELKEPGRLAPYADALLSSVPPSQRELFEIGCGTLPGAAEAAGQALARATKELSFASPRRALETIECPVVICHGRDDDVIPWNEAEKLSRALDGRVPTRLLLTGLYGHTGVGRPGVREIGREVSTLIQMAQAIAWGGELRRRIT